MFKSTYRESVRPNPAAASGLLAMADAVSIVLEHTKQSDTQGALWTAVLVAAVTSWKATDTSLRTPMSPSMLYVPSTRPADLRFTTAALSGMH